MVNVLKLEHLFPFCSQIKDWLHVLGQELTVNSEFFARVYFSRNFAYAKFRENQILAKWRNHSVVY